MDEPTSALADAEVRRLFEVIRSLTARGVAIIYISHRLEELEEIADSVTVLRDGELIGRRDRAETSRPELIQMMVGRPLGQLYPRENGGAAADGGADATRLRVEALTLDPEPGTGSSPLRGVDLTVRAGEIVGLAGLMGAGRTEVLESVFGVHPGHTVDGRFWLDGKPYRPTSPKAAIRHGIAMVAEDRKGQSLVLANSVRFNTSLAALGRFRRRWLTVDKKAERTAVAAQIAELRVKTPGLNTVVNTLSGGNQQKVVLAKCLLTKPSLLLMDEPTRGIDVGAKAEIHTLMNQLAAAGTAILVVSSELPELIAMCDRIVVLCEGRVTGEFTREDADQEAILTAAMARQAVLATVPSPAQVSDD
jgi:ABC-type sugar transport system ATPase subunit